MTLPRRIKRALAALAAVGATAVIAVGSVVAADQTVDIVGLEFQPAEITVAVGEQVTWEVTESIGSPHSVTSGGPDDPDQGSLFDSGDEGLADVGETFEFTFVTAGTFPYYCTVHGASMSGTVTVEEAGASEPPVASEAPASESPEGSEGPGTSQEPGESEGPEASEPPHELRDPIPPERKLLAAGVLAATLVILFGAAAVWRRMNPA